MFNIYTTYFLHACANYIIMEYLLSHTVFVNPQLLSFLPWRFNIVTVLEMYPRGEHKHLYGDQLMSYFICLCLGRPLPLVSGFGGDMH